MPGSSSSFMKTAKQSAKKLEVTARQTAKITSKKLEEYFNKVKKSMKKSMNEATPSEPAMITNMNKTALRTMYTKYIKKAEELIITIHAYQNILIEVGRAKIVLKKNPLQITSHNTQECKEQKGLHRFEIKFDEPKPHGQNDQIRELTKIIHFLDDVEECLTIIIAWLKTEKIQVKLGKNHEEMTITEVYICYIQDIETFMKLDCNNLVMQFNWTGINTNMYRKLNTTSAISRSIASTMVEISKKCSEIIKKNKTMATNLLNRLLHDANYILGGSLGYTKYGNTATRIDFTTTDESGVWKGYKHKNQSVKHSKQFTENYLKSVRNAASLEAVDPYKTYKIRNTMVKNKEKKIKDIIAKLNKYLYGHWNCIPEKLNIVDLRQVRMKKINDNKRKINDREEQTTTSPKKRRKIEPDRTTSSMIIAGENARKKKRPASA